MAVKRETPADCKGLGSIRATAERVEEVLAEKAGPIAGYRALIDLAIEGQAVNRGTEEETPTRMPDAMYMAAALFCSTCMYDPKGCPIQVVVRRGLDATSPSSPMGQMIGSLTYAQISVQIVVWKQMNSSLLQIQSWTGRLVSWIVLSVGF
jgi:hypothetical protein